MGDLYLEVGVLAALVTLALVWPRPAAVPGLGPRAFNTLGAALAVGALWPLVVVGFLLAAGLTAALPPALRH